MFDKPKPTVGCSANGRKEEEKEEEEEVFLYIRAYSFCLESVNRSIAWDLPLDWFLGTRLLQPSVVLYYGPILASYCFTGMN